MKNLLGSKPFCLVSQFTFGSPLKKFNKSVKMTANAHFLLPCISAMISTHFLLILFHPYSPLFLGPVLAQQWRQLGASLRAKLSKFKYQKATEDTEADPKENYFSSASTVHLLVQGEKEGKREPAWLIDSDRMCSACYHFHFSSLLFLRETSMPLSAVK